MKYIVLIITLFVSMAFPQKSHGQGSVNIDFEMIAAMKAMNMLNISQENKTIKNLDKILDNYTAATIAMAGIYDCKKKDRKAIEQAKQFASEELFYYQMAYGYAKMIMQKTLNVVVLLIDRPEAILQWGPYIYDVITKTKDHCQQFSAMVMNGKVTFKDILWLEFSDEFVEIFNLMRLADYDWKGLIDNFSGDFENLTSDISLEDIMDVLKFAFEKGEKTSQESIATAGKEILDEMLGSTQDLFGNSSEGNSEGGIKGSMKKTVSKIKQIKQAVESIMDIYDLATDPSKLKSLFLEKLGLSEPLDPKEVVKKIFTTKNDVDISDYVNDYNTPDSSKFYTQMWYIKKKLNKFEYVYIDDLGEASKDNPKWTRFDVLKSQAFIPPLDELEKVLQNNESQCGWSRNRVESLNTDPDITYKFNADLRSGTIRLFEGVFGGFFGVDFYAFAYQISITKDTHKSTTIDSLLLDTSVDDPALFEAKMKGKLENYKNFDEEGYIYAIEKSSPKYFETADPKKLDISASVTFKAQCNDGGELAQGSSWWKVNAKFRHKGLDSDAARQQAIGEAMQESVDPATLDTMEIHNAIKAAQDSIPVLTAEKSELEKKKQVIIQKINDAPSNAGSNITALRNQLSTVENKISNIENEISVLRSHIEEYEKGKQEILQDFYEQDEGNRIPSQENYLASLFGLEWLGDGEWQGTTYTHKAKMKDGGSGYIVTFKVELSQTRNETRFLGIRFHRAKLQIDWVLTGNAESETVVDVLKIDRDWTREEKERTVNERLKTLQDNFPECTIHLEYETIDDVVNDDEDTIHLLWPNERLDLARDLTARLMNIYARLMEVERYIHYTKSVKEWLKQKLKSPMRPPKRGNMADSCFREWYNRAEKNVKSKNNSIL